MKTTKKLLSVLLAVIMLMTSMSVCFGTVSFAASGTVTADQWDALYNALKADSVKNATFRTVNGKYVVDDPDGNVLKAVQAYFSVFNTLRNDDPATGHPDNTSNSTGSTEGNRVIQQVNASIKDHVSKNMSGYEESMGKFITNIHGGAEVSTGTGATQEKGGQSNNDKTVPATNLSAVSPISISVISGSAVTGYTLDTLPEKVATEKIFTVTHANDRYDYTYSASTSCNKTTYKRTYNYYYYLKDAATVADGEEISTKPIKDAQTVLEADAAYFSYTLDQWVELGFDNTKVITDIRDAVKAAKNSVVNSFSGSVYSHFFSTYNVEDLEALVNKAVDIIAASKIALNLNDYIEAGYADIITNKSALETLANNVKTLAGKYDAYAADVKAYVESHDYEGETFDRAAVTAFYNAVIREIQLIELRNLKAAIEAEIGTFVSYTDEQVADKIVTGTELNYAKGKVDGWISALNTYADANIAEVWEGEDIKAFLAGVSANLEYLITVHGYTDSFANEYAYYVSTVYGNTNIDDESEELLAAVKAYDSWYTGLKNLVNSIEYNLDADLADRILMTMDDEMKAHLDSKYNALNTRVEAQINIAYDLFKAYVDAYGEKVNMATVSEYKAMKDSIGLIDVEIYNFLTGTANFAVSADAITKYREMQKQFPQYEQFINSHGFATYEKNTIDDIVRAEVEGEHDAHIGDYTVTDDKVLDIIATIENLLANDEIKALLGDLINKDEEGNPTGEPFALGALVEGLLNDVVFTDSLINTIIQFVYPLVAKEFAKVWAGLPETMTIEDVDTGFLGIKADVTADLSLDTVEDAIAKVGVFLAPSTLAKNLENAYGKNDGEYAQYTEVISVLKSATTMAVYNLNGEGDEDDTFINPWEDANLFENVYDEETGEQVFNEDGTPKQVYKLNWGVDEAENKREAFLNAACAALSGLEPLLFGILTNTTQANANDSDGVPRGAKIGTGSGSAKVVIDLNLQIDPITLVLKFGGNDGYDNALAPIFEALGLTNIPHGEDLTTTRKILEKGLLDMIDQVITKLDTNPVSFLLEALPNLAYALEADLVAPLLGMLRTEISYYADAQYSVIGLISGSMPEAMKSTDPIIVDLGEMINLEDMGLDISSFSAIWNMLAGSVEVLANLEAPNAGYLATLGSLVEKDTNRSAKTYTGGTAGKAYHIDANKADVLIYLLRYVLNALTPELLASFDLELTDDINAIIEGVTADPDKTIAAIVELLNGVEYDTLKEYVWYVSELNEATVVGMTPAIQQYLAYDNNWTKATATYLVENVDAIIGAVAGEEFDLSETLSGLLGTLFTNKNITALAKLLSKIDLNALLAGDAEEGAEDKPATAAEGEEDALDINALVNKFAGIDLSSFAAYAELADDYNWGFEDGDKAGFAAAIVNLLAPLSPVLAFILEGENLALLDGDVELIGYNGYDSALVPLLEALGAAPAALADGDDALTAVLNALVARIDAIVANPVEEILNLIPSLLYFVKSNGLTTAVRNLIQPVLVILETIDPVYALNLNELIAGLTKDMGFSIDLGNLSFEAIFDILGAVVALDLAELEEIIDDVCEVITPVTYTSASSLIGENGKKGAYGKYFDAADLVTVLVSFALSWVQEGNNAADIVALIAGDDAEKAAEIQKYITGAITVIGGIEPEYQQIDWDYNFPANYEETIFESGLSIAPTIDSIEYLTNWTEDTAKYVADNLDVIADEIISLIDENYSSVSDFIAANVNIYTSENIDAIVAAVTGLLEGVDATLIDAAGLLLGADIAALKAYKAPEGIEDAEGFAGALTDVLEKIQPVVDWLLFGEDYALFSKNDTDLVTIKGAEGYAYGLAPILEALGVDAPAKDEATVESVLNAVFARVDAILGDPVNEVLDVLPNVVYFLNANGISVSVQNLLAGVTGLMGAVQENFGVEIDLMTIINDLINGLLPEESGITIDVTNLNLESIFALVQSLTSLDLAPIANIFVGLCVGNIVAYTSASGEYGFKMQYNDEFARYDMITIIATALLQIIQNKDNEEVLKDMVGEGAYDGIVNVLALEVNVPVQDFDWKITESADTGEVFSAILSSELFSEFSYGPLYTKEMEQYISDNFGLFVDNIIYLLGLEINGNTVESLSELLNGLVGGSVYNSSVVATVRDALAGLVGTLETNLPAGAHIIEILKTTGIADLKAISKVEIGEFSDDRILFTEKLCEVLSPMYTLLEWLLADADLTFFVDNINDETDEYEVVVKLPGAEGYAYGIIPVLEALGCEDILTAKSEVNENGETVYSGTYYEAIKSGKKDALITSILNPLLDRVDEILANPADEILSILPNLIYFINSNGVDTVVKNTLNAVYTLLNAIEPIAKVDLYELVGLDLSELTFEKIFEMLIGALEEATGYELSVFDANAFVELTTGTLESYISANGKTAYKMVYQAAEAKGEMVTVVLRLALTFLALDENVESVIGILKDNLGMNEDAEKYVRGILKVLVECLTDTKLGIDVSLATIYYIYLGADLGVDGAVGGYDGLKESWQKAVNDLKKENPALAALLEDVLSWEIFEDVLDYEEGLAPNGFIAFFQKIAAWFQKIVDWFRNLFSK